MLVFVSYNVGLLGGNTAVGEERMNYKQLMSNMQEVEERLERKKTEFYDLNEEVRILEVEIENKREAIDEALAIYEDRKKIEMEIQELDIVLSKKKDELASITGELKRKEGDPIVLSAGHYVVGKDLPPGRYIAEANGGSGNFFVRNDGRSKVSVTLGEGGMREEEYVFFAESGDTMELNTATKFTKVE